MSSVPPDPFRLPVRILALAGLGGLAILTLLDRGATRMFATPWLWLLAVTLSAPPAVLLLRLAVRGPALRLPSPAWLLAASATTVVPLFSAWLSPYRGPSLLAVSVPFAATCLFLLMHDWLRANEERHRFRLEQILAGSAAAVAVVSTVLWLGDIVALSRAELLSSAVFQMRNPHPLGHSNYTAGLMLLGLPWLGRLAWHHRGPWRSAAFLAMGLALLNLFTSGSRGGLLGLAALGVTSVAVARPGWKRFSLWASGAVLIAFLFAAANPRIRALLGPGDPSAESNLSTVQRTAMLQAGAMMGRDRPLLGWGPGTTPLAYPRYRHALEGGAENVLQLHSTPLQFWAETGAAGLLAAMAMAGLVALNWKRSPAAAATLAGYGVFALTDYQLDVPVFAATTAVLTALLAMPSAPLPANGRRLGLGLAVFAVAGLIVAFGARDRAPLLNAQALSIATDPARHSRAVTLLNESLALNPDQEIAHFNLGWLLLVPEPAKAEQHFLAAARLVPDKGGVYFGLGLSRLNQGRREAAARAFALESVNDPRFLASPWWTVPEIAAQRAAAAAEYDAMLARCLANPETPGVITWRQTQAGRLRSLAPRLGQVSPGPEANYRRERLGYPVLMRNLDLAPPVDLYDVREDPRFPASLSFPLPDKGWLPSPVLLKLLDAPAPPPP
jgi:O-antigen ligase